MNNSRDGIAQQKCENQRTVSRPFRYENDQSILRSVCSSSALAVLRIENVEESMIETCYAYQTKNVLQTPDQNLPTSLHTPL